MNAASHSPSGVLIVTSVSVTGIAAEAGPAAATMPAATDMAMKSRRERSLAASSRSSESCFSFVIGSLLFSRWFNLECPHSSLPLSKDHMPAALGCQRSRDDTVKALLKCPLSYLIKNVPFFVFGFALCCRWPGPLLHLAPDSLSPRMLRWR